MTEPPVPAAPVTQPAAPQLAGPAPADPQSARPAGPGDVLQRALGNKHLVRGDGAQLLSQPAGKPPAQAPYQRVVVEAGSMGAAARKLAAEFTRHYSDGTPTFLGIGRNFLVIYDKTGKETQRLALNPNLGMTPQPGVYKVPDGGTTLVAITAPGGQLESPWGTESGPRAGAVFAAPKPKASSKSSEPKESGATKDEAGGAAKKGPEARTFTMEDVVTDRAALITALAGISWRHLVLFVPRLMHSAVAPQPGTSDEGLAPNAAPWPVRLEGPILVPTGADPTYSATVDWSGQGNSSIGTQAVAQIGQYIHYQWERYDITKYARERDAELDKKLAKDDFDARVKKVAGSRTITGDDRGNRCDVSGSDVTGVDKSAERDIKNWWTDTQNVAAGVRDPRGDSWSERTLRRALNLASLNLSGASLALTVAKANWRMPLNLLAGERAEQEVPLRRQGTYLIRVIATPAIQKDAEGHQVIRPATTDSKVVEVAPIDETVSAALGESDEKIAKLEAELAKADDGQHPVSAEVLREEVLAEILRTRSSPLDLLKAALTRAKAERAEAEKEAAGLHQDRWYRADTEVETLEARIALYERQEAERTGGSKDLPAAVRLNAVLISEETAVQYPLLLSAGPMAMAEGQHQWMINDVTDTRGGRHIGRGATPSAAFVAALEDLAREGGYGRGRIGARTAGLGLEEGARAEYFVTSSKVDGALFKQRLADLITLLAIVGLAVPVVGQVAIYLGGAVAVANLYERYRRSGRIELDAEFVSDLIAVMTALTLGAAGRIGAQIRSFGKVSAVVRDGVAGEKEFSSALEVIGRAEKTVELQRLQNMAKVLEAANKTLNYGALVWGDAVFFAAMKQIADQEAAGAITHAEARRRRADAIQGAVTNHGLFVAGMANHEAPSHEAPSHEAPSHEAPSHEAPSHEAPSQAEQPRSEQPRSEQPPQEHEPAAPKPEAAPKPPKLESAAEPPRATADELRAALPADLRGMLVVDLPPTGDSVHVGFEVDAGTGLITEIRIHCSPDARPETVAQHVRTVRTMQGYQGLAGRVRQAVRRIAELFDLELLDPSDPQRFAAELEIRKLPDVIRAQMRRMSELPVGSPEWQNADLELESLEFQLDRNVDIVEFGGFGGNPGYVGATGLSAEVKAEIKALRVKYEAAPLGSIEKALLRYQIYRLMGGTLDLLTWLPKYRANETGQARKGNQKASEEQERRGWGDLEVPVEGFPRREDIMDRHVAPGEVMRAIEVKWSEDGRRVPVTDRARRQLQIDAQLVAGALPGGRVIVTWVFIDTEPTGPLLELLVKAGIVVETRVTIGPGKTRMTSRTLNFSRLPDLGKLRPNPR